MCLLVVASAAPNQESNRDSRNLIQTEDDLLNSVHQDCLRKDSIACLKYRVFSYADKMMGGLQDSTPIIEGVNVVKTGDVSETKGAPRALKPDATIESVLMDRVARFLSTHTLKIDLSGKDVVTAVGNTARSISDTYDNLTGEEEYEEIEDDFEEEGRKKKGGKKKIKKIKKVLGPFLGIFALKAAFLAKLALLGIALLAGKALIIGKIALTISLILAGLKLFGSKLGLLKGGGSGAIVDHHDEHDFSGYGGGYSSGGYSHGVSGGSGWGRSSDAQSLAYKAYAPETKQQ